MRCDAGWGEWSEVDGGSFVGEELCHDECGCGGEEDSVAVVACGDEVVGVFGKSADEGKTVGCCGAQTGPGFELWGVGDGRKQCGGECAEVMDVVGVDRFVEAGVFDCCSDDCAASGGAGGAGDYIDVGCADDEVKRK